MRIVHAKPLPRCFAKHPHAKGLLAECDIRPTRAGRLHMKLVVFDRVDSLRAFWKDGLGKGSIGRSVGVVSALAYEIHTFPKRVPRYGTLPDTAKGYTSHIEADPRYFAIMGLCVRWLSMEIVCHESVHAGFAYAKRRRGDYWEEAKRFDEESVAYPSGRIARAVNRFLHDKGLYR